MILRDASPPSTPADPHWHLSDLFPDDAAADRAIEALEADVEALQLPTAWPDVASLVATLTALDDLRLRRDLVRTYAHSQRDTDGFDAAIARRAARVDALIARFDQRAAVLEPRLLATYERIRQRFADGYAFVAAHRERCTSCKMQVPHVMYMQLMKGKEILACESCGRLLYWSGHFPEDEAKLEPAPKAAPGEVEASTDA